MGDFDDATRQMKPAGTIICPYCTAMDIPGASPTIEVVNGRATCSTCSKSFLLKPAA